ncbi:hypothetical protein F4802DRAFT_199186 [Xylaria palmicola]|nr:hypothetical protein F4802DRAFT_199186 [Xylaria palmicola]
MTSILRSAIVVGSLLVHRVTCVRPTSTVTTTIAWTGTSTTSATITPCTGPATVVVETPFTTPTCAPAPPPLQPAPCETLPDCGAAGFNIDYYQNPVGNYGTGNVPSSYYISQGLSPLDSSLTNVTFFPQDAPPASGTAGWTRATNGGVTVNANNFTLVYSGFYRAPVTGLYSLCSSSDNQNDVFFGRGSAFSCDSGLAPAGPRPLVTSLGGNLVNPTTCVDVYLFGGRYYPVRNVMGNYGGPSAFNFTIWEPNEPYDAKTNDFTGSVFPLSCRWFKHAN